MENVDEGDEAHARREEAERAARANTDPMVVTCPVTGAKRRPASVPPMQGFGTGTDDARQWLDDQNARGQIVDKRDSLHVIGCAALLARQHLRRYGARGTCCRAGWWYRRKGTCRAADAADVAGEIGARERRREGLTAARRPRQPRERAAARG